MAYETWNNNDSAGLGFGRPEWPYERQTRTVAYLTTANSTAAGATTIKFTLAANVATLGVTGGLYVNLLDQTNGMTSASANLSSNGSIGLFFSNVTTTAVAAGNLVTLSSGTTGIIPAGSVIAFDAAIVRPAGEVSSTYNADTVLATDTRLTAANNKIGGNPSTGWVHVRKKTNGLTGEVRYIRETLVCLTNASSTNTAGGNTSWGRAFANT
jgi:hypothetical protein